MSISSQSFIPLRKAAKKYKTTVDHLSYLVDSGKIKSVDVNSVTCISELDIMDNLPRRDRPEYQPFLHLSGVGIGIGEGARKYNIPDPTISRWVKRGLIEVLGREGKQKILIDEADLAYCANVYHADPSDKQGRWLFTASGAPRRKVK